MIYVHKYDAQLKKNLLGTIEGDAHHIHEQSIAAAIWEIIHNLGKEPVIDVFTNEGEKLLVTPLHIVENGSCNKSTITFSNLTYGRAICS
jgi:hypothetical protein